MRVSNFTRKISILFFAISFVCFANMGFAFDSPESEGSFTECSYSDGLSSPDYASAEIFYPCEISAGPFAATTLTGGFTNTKEQMYWLSGHVVTHGYVVIAVTPNNNLGVNVQWRTAHKAGIEMLKSENARKESPIYGLVDTNRLQIMGFSKGGGGALMASSDLGSEIRSTQALAPYMDGAYDLSGITSATICHTGTTDNVAAAGNVVTMYNSLPDGIERTLAYFNDVAHVNWFGATGNNREMLKTYVTSWMKFYLDGDNGYYTYLYGDAHQDHMDAGWFYNYSHNEDFSNGGGSGGCGGCGN